MNRRRIEMHRGAIAPTSHGLWGLALEKLDEAQSAIDRMSGATDRIQYEKGWAQFLDSLEEFWTRFYNEGKSKFGSFPPWAGVIVAKRKADEGLQYLYQGRHQSQHGRVALLWDEPKVHIAPGFSGTIARLRVYPDGTYKIDATPSHPSVPEATLTFDPGSALLPVVENKRFNQSYDPPSTIDGHTLASKDPIALARHGLTFYRNVLKQRQQEFAPPGTQ